MNNLIDIIRDALENASPEERDKLDKAFVNLCGWPLTTLIEKLWVSNAAAGIDANSMQTCAECGAQVNEIIGCPDGAEICQACFDAGKH